MENEKMIADQLQCMFLEGKLPGINERYINQLTRKLRTGCLTVDELIDRQLLLKEQVMEAASRVVLY
jgi:hypothetical protein